MQSGPSSHRATGLLLATGLPLTAKGPSLLWVSNEGMRGLKRGENKEPNNKDDRIPESRGAGRSTI